MASCVDVFCDSRHRQSFPGGDTYNFSLINCVSTGSSTQYQVMLQRAEIPNQYANVFVGINDTLYFKFTKPVNTAYNEDTTVHAITFDPGNYGAADFAAGLQADITSAFPAQWSVPGPGVPTYAVGYDALQGTLQFTITNGFGLIFTGSSSEVYHGSPGMTPSMRMAQMLGLHYYYALYPSGRSMISTGAAINTEVLAISGSKHVDIAVSFPTSNLHSDGSLSGHILGRVSLGPLGSIAVFQRADEDRGTAFVGGDELQHMRIQLYDEWGIPFFLPSSHNISFTLRLYPGQTSDYSG